MVDISSMKNNEPNQITEELKQSEVQEDINAVGSDESFDAGSEIGEFVNESNNEDTIQGLEQKL